MKDEEKAFEKWKPIIDNYNLSGSSWMDGFVVDAGSQTYFPDTGTTFPSLLPLSIKIASQTVGLDLVSVAPIGMSREKFKTQERMKKLKRLLGDSFHDVVSKEEYEEAMKCECLPKGTLMYLDFKYEPPQKKLNLFDRFKIWFKKLFIRK